VETLGYIEPGHGLRGKQQWLTRECDLEDMYRSLKNKKEVTIWCFQPSNPHMEKFSVHTDISVLEM